MNHCIQPSGGRHEAVQDIWDILMSQARVVELVHMKFNLLQSSLAPTIIWYPVFVPQMVGDCPESEVTQNMDVRHWVRPLGLSSMPLVVVGLFNVNFPKSSLIWQISVSDLQTSKVQTEVSLVVLEK